MTAGPKERIRVMVVDDHAAVRRGLSTFLLAFGDLEMVADAASGEEAVRRCPQVQPDVVLMDLVMPGIGGAGAICLIRERWPEIKVIALTSFQEADLMQEALDAGAVCCLLKNVSADELADAIRLAHGSELPPNGDGSDPCLRRTRALDEELKPREREVLAMLVRGLDYGQIADKLTVNALTAKFHVSNVLYKLGVASRHEAVALALQRHLVS